jgi:hypothetical protein
MAALAEGCGADDWLVEAAVVELVVVVVVDPLASHRGDIDLESLF